jgi:serine/threonine-protein kinase
MHAHYRSPDNDFSSYGDFSKPLQLKQHNPLHDGPEFFASPEETSTLIGKTVSHYRVLEKIGEGGMGYIYKALDLNLQRRVALKVLSGELCKNSEVRNRFLQEARLLSAVEHAHICTIHDIFEDKNGVLYMVMPFYQGHTLRTYLKKNTIEQTQILLIIKQIGNGLSSAHKKGIIHQDIKPENIIITTGGVVKIIDFGIAQLLGWERNFRSSSSAGTPAYMSPEQIHQLTVDERSDIWSLGVVFYEMLAGHLPFENEFEEGLVYMILNDVPPRINKINDRLHRTVLKCLAKDRTERYQTINAMLSDLEVIMVRDKRLHRNE